MGPFSTKPSLYYRRPVLTALIFRQSFQPSHFKPAEEVRSVIFCSNPVKYMSDYV